MKYRASIKLQEISGNLIHQPWLRNEPGRDTLLAAATLLYFIPTYYFGANTDHILALINFVFATTVVLVVLPTYYVLKVEGEPLSDIAITCERLLPSLVLSAFIISRYLPSLQDALVDLPGERVVPHLVYCGVCFWEPFFVHCWMQLRLEKAFGILPGILGAGFTMASYHIGTYDIEMLMMLVLVGLIYGVLFRLARNILVLWPFTWAGAAAMGTIRGGVFFGWRQACLYSAVLVVQLACLYYFSRSKGSNDGLY